MDLIGFNGIDKEFQKELEDLRAKKRKEIERSMQTKQFEFSFSDAEIEWKLRHIPGTGKEKDRDRKNHEAAMKLKEQKIRNLVETSIAKEKLFLEKLHFGDIGRKGAFERAEREEKILAFKARQANYRQVQALKNKNQARKLVLLQKKTVTKEQNNRKLVVNMSRQYSKVNRDGLIKYEINKKIKNFKKRNAHRCQGKQESVKNAHATKADNKHGYDQKEANIKDQKRHEFKQSQRELLNRDVFDKGGIDID